MQKQIDVHSKAIKGYRLRLAEAMNCHNSFLSHVLNGSAHITPDQASALCDFWNYDPIQSELFMALVNLERAGTESLKKRLKLKIEELRAIPTEDFTEITVKNVTLSYDQGIRYFGHWYTSTVHALLSLKTMRNKNAIANHLNLPLRMVQNALDQLVDMGLIKEEEGEWVCTKEKIRMTDSRELLFIYHKAMRERAGHIAAQSDGAGIHYTGYWPMTKARFIELREAFHNILHNFQKEPEDPASDEVVLVCLDFCKT